MNMYNTIEANKVEQAMRNVINNNIEILYNNPENGKEMLINKVLHELNDAHNINVASLNFYQNIWYEVLQDLSI